MKQAPCALRKTTKERHLRRQHRQIATANPSNRRRPDQMDLILFVWAPAHNPLPLSSKLSGNRKTFCSSPLQANFRRQPSRDGGGKNRIGAALLPASVAGNYIYAKSKNFIIPSKSGKSLAAVARDLSV